MLKTSILNKIETPGINNAKTLDFLYLNYFPLKRAKEFEFILEHWSKARKEVSWVDKKLSKHLDVENLIS